jgi:alanine racemase
MLAELTVDLAALRRNAVRLRALVQPGANLGAVVKANGYGHGLVPVARALAGVADGFCVYRVDEAVALRDAGIAGPILVLGPVEPRHLSAGLAARVGIPLWDDGAFRRDVARAARAAGTRFPVHAKLDTGVTRLGLDPADATRVLASYLSDEALEVRGVYTHLAAAEELESAFTHAQLAAFERATEPFADALRERGARRHTAASAAAMLYPESRFDLVRAGIALYGIWPSAQTQTAVGAALELEPVLTWTTRLVVVREVEAGRSVGYGCAFHTARPSRIGVLPIGYAEGLPRALSGGANVLVGGKRVPLVGRICMNMAFVDVTGVPDARPGTQVTLLGRDGDEAIDPNELAARAGTIGYELVARLPAEVPRRYVDEPALQTVEPAGTLRA